MDLSQRLSISYYKTIATLNKEHNVYLVQHQNTGKIYVKKLLDIYNIDIYQTLLKHPIPSTPKIVELYEDNGQLTLIENFICGDTLLDILNSHTLEIESICHYILELCLILEKMHSFTPPIIHRDIKPSNLIITEHNHVILLDFNAAKYYINDEKKDTILLGTQGYAAPEQYGFGSSTPKTDIYALGILLKEMLSDIDNIPKELSEICNKCIQINPKDRFHTVTELKIAIENLSSPQAFKPKKTHSITSAFLPGYRSLCPWKMLLATPTYLFIIWLCMTLEVKNVTQSVLWLERCFCFSMILSMILIGFNWLNIQRFFPLCKHKNKIIHYVGIILFDFLVVMSLFFLMFILELSFFR